MTAPADIPHRESTKPGETPAALVDRILDLYQRLDRLGSSTGLEPSAAVNAAYTELVGLSLSAPGRHTDAALDHPGLAAVLPRLWDLCADGEYRLERSWARRVAAAADPAAELAAFPYLDNYRDLTALEVHAVAGLRPAAARLPRVCVLGSGPLPLTAILTARTLGCPVDAVDVSTEATDLAAAVLRRVPGGRLVRTHRANASAYPEMDQADVVVLAALVGFDPGDKLRAVAAVAERMRPGAVLIVRSAHRLRTLLYPPVTPDELLHAGLGRLSLLAEIHPWNEVLNSLLVAVRT